MPLSTPTKTYAETLSNSVATGGRLSVALEEMKRRLETELPGFITYVNTELSLQGGRAIQQFKGFGIAPVDLTQGHINKLLIGADVSFSAQGSRGFRASGTLMLYLIEPAWRDEAQYLSAIDRAGVVRMLLHNYLQECRDPRGRLAWKTLAPQDEQPLPEKWRNYAGVALPYLVVQPAGEDLWAV